MTVSKKKKKPERWLVVCDENDEVMTCSSRAEAITAAQDMFETFDAAPDEVLVGRVTTIVRGTRPPGVWEFQEEEV